MTRHLHLDPTTGVSGDMLLGALIDAGAPVDLIRDDLRRLELPGWTLDVERVVRHGISGSLAHVGTADTATHRSASELRRIIRAAGLPSAISDRAVAVIDRIAVAESAIHGIDVEDVHFHEVGALDTIVDVVGVCSALHHLGVESATCAPLPTGSGTVMTAHGELPVPAPATLRLLEGTGHVWRFTDDPMELVTPTGAALVAELTTPSTGIEMTVSAIGYGFGTSTKLPRANCLRTVLGVASSDSPAAADEPSATRPVVLLSATIDDQSPERIAAALDACVDAGAHEAWSAAVAMKKRRLGTDVTVVCPIDAERAVVDVLFTWTTTLGVRRQPIDRYEAERSETTVVVEGRPVRVKARSWRGRPIGWKPEHDDVIAVARSSGRTPDQVAAAVDQALQA
ncbi:MAG: TIGR00299 family protein [Acidimicrobiaceae bacterium]|nr:TIGR00299 family protein [Acidimicrobiaceae bacterium]